MVRVLILSAGDDTGGVGSAISRAFARHKPQWSVRFVRRSDNYIRYPFDIEWLPGEADDEVMALWRQADLIHHFEKWVRLDGWIDKPKVLHHHGSAFRRSPQAWITEARKYGATTICSTMDIVSFAPAEMAWVPNPYDLDMLATIRAETYRPCRALRIAHAPTNRNGKSTAAFLAACNRLSQEREIAVDLIERTTWAECLTRKAAADIYYDQVLTAYGNNATEAWGMGIPVIAGVQPERATLLGIPVPSATRDRMLDAWGGIPFVEATEETIYEALKLLSDPDARRVWADRGLAHVRRWHDEREVVRRLSSIYEGALDDRPVSSGVVSWSTS